MNPALRFPLFAFSTMLVAIVAFGVAREDVALLLGAALPAAASWMVTEGPRRRGLPRWLTTVLVLAVVAWTLLQSPLRTDPVGLASTVGEFVLWTSVIKLYERKSTRDRRQLLGLSLVLMLSGCLATAHLIFGALLVIYTVLMVASLMLYRLERGAEMAAERSRSVAPGMPPPPPVFGGRAGRQLRRIVATGLIVGLAVSLVLFVLFPRDIMSRLDGWGGAARVSGFRTNVDLRTNARIAMSRREVMRVQWLDPVGEPVSAIEPLLMRGAALDRYDAGQSRWVSTRDARTARPVPSESELFEPLGRPPIDLKQQTYTQIVEMRLLITDVIFSAWAPVALSYPGFGAILFDGGTLEMRDPEWERGPRVWHYRVKVQPFLTPDSMMALAGQAVPWREPRFTVQGVTEEARRVLGQVGQSAPDPTLLRNDPEFRWAWARQASGIFLRYLQGSGFRYSTDLSEMVLRRGEDPIDAFLRRGRSGHCELFASALCGMLQSVGVEARVVVGFVALEYDEATKAYLVRENNAHAWVEVRTGDWTWSTVDPTPADTLATLSDAGRSWTDSLRWVYDGIDFIWRTRVVAFDAGTQTSIMQETTVHFGAWLRRVVSSVGDGLETLSRQFESGGVGRIWAVSVVVALLGVAAISVLLSRRERRWRRLLRLEEIPSAQRRRVRRGARFFADALMLLEGAGAAKPDWRPPLLHAEKIRSVDRGAGDAFARITEIYYEIRFGGAVPSQSSQTEVASLLRRIEAGLRRAKQS